MPNYVEGFVVPAPKGKLKAYFRIACGLQGLARPRRD